MATPSGSVRQRAPKKKTSSINIDADSDHEEQIIETIQRDVKTAVKSEWDYKLALVVLTIAAFVTRFWGISHPNQVVVSRASDQAFHSQNATYHPLTITTIIANGPPAVR
jgi:hypothetical protein